jgi:hypothetical protein
VAQENAQVFVDLDTTFKALASVAPSIGAATEAGPPSLTQAIHSLVFERPFIRQLTRFFALLQPSAVALRGAAPTLGPAVAAGVRNLPVATEANRKLSVTLAQLASFATDPGVIQGLQDLTLTASGGTPIFADLAGMQQTCNYPTLLVRNFSDAMLQGSSVGLWMRAAPMFDYGAYVPPVSIPTAPPPETAAEAAARTFFGANGQGAPAAAPANGGVNQPATNPLQAAQTSQIQQINHLHINPYPNVGAPGQPKGVCEAGNEVYVPGKTVIGNPPNHTNFTDFTKGG